MLKPGQLEIGNSWQARNTTQESSSFWLTLPGIMTGIARLVTAVGGLLLVREPGRGGRGSPRSREAKVAPS